MIRLSPEAEAQIDALLEHYERLGRVEATRNLIAVLNTASARIERDPGFGLLAPRPYPSLAKTGRLWLHVRPYWVGYSTTAPPVISAVFYDAADIPGRLGI